MPEPRSPRRRRPTRSESGGKPGSQGLPIYLDPSYTTNLCPNPSFEASTAGWTATDSGTTLAQSNLQTLYGAQALQVTTNGSIPGQGVIGPYGFYPGIAGLAAMTASIWGEAGTVLVSFVNGAGGAALASQAVVLDGSGWQTVIFADVSFPANAKMYALFQTVGPEDIIFYVDGVMYQPEGTPHPYIDGDLPQVFWTGTAELSTSYQPYQYAIGGTLSFWGSGYANVVVPGEVIDISPPVLEFFVDPLDGTLATVATVAGALTDFGIWTSTDPDPAQTYGWYTNAGTLSSQTGYTQIYGMLVPPLDYPVSGGSYAWRRAAYAAVGFKWASVPTATEQILTDVQLQYCHTDLTPNASTASAFQRPRQLQVIIKPDRLNYITNPAFQVSTVGWSQDGSTVTMTPTPYVWPPNISTYDNIEYSAFQSCQVVLNSALDSGIQISVPFLIPGETYMASCYVMTTSNGLADILGACSGGAADVAGLMDPEFCYGGGGTEGYGAGPYGGVTASDNPLPSGVWTRLSFAFVAGSDTEVLFITATYLAGGSSVLFGYPQSFYVTGVMIEPGDILLPYFDGNSGQDAMWEYSGGTTTPEPGGGTVPGSSRSYYYTQLQFGQAIVSQTLASNTPLGISYATPLYATPPNQ